MNRLSLIVLMSSFAFCGCAAVEATATDLRALIAKVDSKVDGVASTAKGAVDTIAGGVHAVESRVAAVEARSQAALDKVAAAGANVDNGASGLASWSLSHPGDALRLGPDLLLALAALAAGMKARKNGAAASSSAAQLNSTQVLLDVMHRSIEDHPDAEKILAPVQTVVAADPAAAVAFRDAKAQS